MGKIRLSVSAISDGGSASGACVLILEEVNGIRKIPIVIGQAEAQSIAIHIDGRIPPRPLTHDLFFSFACKFGIEILEVSIHKFKNGTFFANLLCFDGENEITIDSRTSDAVALALRFRCPIFATEKIMEETGISSEDCDFSDRGDLRKYSKEELYMMLNRSVDAEDYEKASQIRDELKFRNNKTETQ